MSDMGNTDGDGSLSGIDVTKYNNLLIPNEHGYFLVTDEDINRYNELNSDQKRILKFNIVGLFLSDRRKDENLFIEDGKKKFVKKAAIDEAIETMNKQIPIENEKRIANEKTIAIQSVANLDGPNYFEKIREKWNSVNLSDKNKTDLLQILKARQQALSTTPALADNDTYTYGLTVRLNKNNNKCDKKQDLSVPDGEWKPFVTNDITEKDKNDFSDLIKAVDQERKCSWGNEIEKKFTSASSYLKSMSPFSSSPAAGGRRTKKRSSRRARKTRVKARKSGKRARARARRTRK